MSHCRLSVRLHLCTGNRQSFCQNRRHFHKMLRRSCCYAGKITCDGERNGSCVFTISQDICVAVPVEFGATATKLPPKISAPIAANSKFLRQNKPFTKAPDSFRGFFLFEGIFLYLDNPLCLE